MMGGGWKSVLLFLIEYNHFKKQE
uniref:Uncharacterized protein n=1 Tax=Anguilla anguilla TaxID=7936 RepID=A0A0E9V6M6_ANGAN